MPDKTNIDDATKTIAASVEQNQHFSRSLPEWRAILARECQVYVLGENFIAKRFDQINYKYCEEKEAINVVRNNLYALLRSKYFPKQTEEIDDRISAIVSSFVTNLMTTLIKVTLNENDKDLYKISFLPTSCIAFKNGVFDFHKNKWLFKYKVTKMPQIGNKIYSYDPTYIIMWYFDIEFTPIEDFNLNTLTLHDMISIFKTMCEHKSTRNMCFELMYNIAHDADNTFDEGRFEHLCQILGYLLLQDFCQAFVMLIGAGSNGKNSLFDGCFTSHVIPAVTSNSLEDIEKDRFITGTLQNKSHNIFLETSAITHEESKMIKQLTGSMYQTIEMKGVQKYSGIINCKYIFSGNDQENIKFSDNTTGFRRRINLYEIYYTWDPHKRFMKRGDYYDTTFSEDLRELKRNITNVFAFVYFGMYGIKSATDNFTKQFKFTRNEWKQSYTDIDFDDKDKIESITAEKISTYIKSRQKGDIDVDTLFYDVYGHRLISSKVLDENGYKGLAGLLTIFENQEANVSFFAENDVFISTKQLLKLTKLQKSTAQFNSSLKKIYKLDNNTYRSMYANTMYVKCTFIKGRLKIIGS